MKILFSILATLILQASVVFACPHWPSGDYEADGYAKVIDSRGNDLTDEFNRDLKFKNIQLKLVLDRHDCTYDVSISDGITIDDRINLKRAPESTYDTVQYLDTTHSHLTWYRRTKTWATELIRPHFSSDIIYISHTGRLPVPKSKDETKKANPSAPSRGSSFSIGASYTTIITSVVYTEIRFKLRVARKSSHW